MKLSIVVPMYCCEGTIEQLVTRCNASMTLVPNHLIDDYEFILVDDRSPQKDWAVIKRLAQTDGRVKGIRLSRNFGQHAAITAGLARASGDCVVVMDGDLQDRPEEIPQLIDKYSQGSGYDAVVARRADRKDRWIKKSFSRFFYWILHILTGYDLDPATANFGIYSKRLISAVLSLKDKYRFFPLFVKWVGFEITAMDVIHSERTIGKSAYSFGKALRMATNAFLSFSNKPLRIMTYIGMVLSVISFALAVLYFAGALIKGYAVQGWPSLIISIWFIGSVQLLFLGLVGMYVAKNFEQSKNRPLYIVCEASADTISDDISLSQCAI